MPQIHPSARRLLQSRLNTTSDNSSADIKPDAVELESSDDELLRALACVKPQKGQLVPTVAGILLFGKPIALRRLFPMFRIDYVRTSSREWVAEPDDELTTVEIREPLIRAIPKARDAMLDDLPKTTEIPPDGLQRTEQPLIPSRVVREVVVNAVMHRSYTQFSPVTILRYPNRIELRNPGHSLVSEDRLEQPGSETRNPAVAAVLYDIGYADTKGYGIEAMRKRMTSIDLSPPVFESDRAGNRFVAWLLFHPFLTDGDRAWVSQVPHELTNEQVRALVFAREMGAVDNPTYRSLNGVDSVSASRDLRHLCRIAVLDVKGRGHRTHYKLREAAFSGGLPPHKGGLDRNDGGLQGGAREEPPFAELPVNLEGLVGAIGPRAKKEKVRKVVLELCSWRPLMPQEIAHYLNRHSIKSLVASYVGPMTEEGLLERTYPDIPSHPGQQYRTTYAGIRELTEELASG